MIEKEQPIDGRDQIISLAGIPMTKEDFKMKENGKTSPNNPSFDFVVVTKPIDAQGKAANSDWEVLTFDLTVSRSTSNKKNIAQ